MGKLMEGKNTSVGSRAATWFVSDMLQSSLLEGCGNSDYGGDSSPTRCLINILSIATILKKASNKTTTKF